MSKYNRPMRRYRNEPTPRIESPTAYTVVIQKGSNIVVGGPYPTKDQALAIAQAARERGYKAKVKSRARIVA
jgi:hypothetical protein